MSRDTFAPVLQRHDALCAYPSGGAQLFIGHSPTNVLAHMLSSILLPQQQAIYDVIVAQSYSQLVIDKCLHLVASSGKTLPAQLEYWNSVYGQGTFPSRSESDLTVLQLAYCGAMFDALVAEQAKQVHQLASVQIMNKNEKYKLRNANFSTYDIEGHKTDTLVYYLGALIRSKIDPKLNEFSLPFIVDKITFEVCFEREATPKTIEHLIHKCMPQKYQIHNVCQTIIAYCAEVDFDLVYSVMMASQFGLYRHCRGTKNAQEQHVMYTKRAVTRNDFISWLKDQPQLFVVNAMREFIIAQLQFSPVMYSFLCNNTAWRNWQQGIIDFMDAYRLGLALTPTDDDIFVKKFDPFDSVFLNECRKYLTGSAAVRAPLDARWTPEMDLLMQSAIRLYSNPSELIASTLVLKSDASDDELDQHLFKPHLFPLRLFYLTAQVIHAFAEAETTYQVTRATDSVVHVVEHIASKSLYQLQALHAFVKHRSDAQSVQLLPLPSHLAHAQHQSLRRILNTQVELPHHMITGFVCFNCSPQPRFCVHSVTSHEKYNSVSTTNKIGIDRVMLSHTSVEHNIRLARESRGYIVPKFADLRVPPGTTLLDFYRDNVILPEVHEVEEQLVVNHDECESDGSENMMSLLPPTPALFAKQKRMYEDLLPHEFRMVGHADATNQGCIWVCGKEKIQHDERFNSSSVKHRTDSEWVTFYHDAQCHQRRVFEVELATYALKVGDTLHVCCCYCLQFTDYSSVTWYGSMFLCVNCIVLHRQFENLNNDLVQASYRCIVCNCGINFSEKVFSVEVINDLRLRDQDPFFTLIFACAKDQVKVDWLLRLPVIPHLSEITRDLESKVKVTSQTTLSLDRVFAQVTDTLDKYVYESSSSSSSAIIAKPKRLNVRRTNKSLL